MIKAICFDLDGVYFTPEGKKAFEASLIDLSIPEEKVIHALYKSDEMLSFVKGEMSEDDFWNYIRVYFEKDLTNDEFINLWTKDYTIDTSVKDLVQKVKKNGYKTCTCSNNNPSRIRSLNAKFGFIRDFDVAVFSYEIGEVKPNKKIFEELILRADVKPDELVYSDDQSTRLQGAKELGINTFVYEGFNQFKQELIKLNVNIN